MQRMAGLMNTSCAQTACSTPILAIVDFTSGQDDFRASASGFGGGLAAGGTPMVAIAAPAAGASGGATGYFIFDTTDDALFRDTTGGSGADAIRLAHLQNVNSLAAHWRPRTFF
jgi:hypothetical protein